MAKRKDIPTVILVTIGFIGAVVCFFIRFDLQQQPSNTINNYSLLKIATGVFIVLFILGLFSYSKKLKQ